MLEPMVDARLRRVVASVLLLLAAAVVASLHAGAVDGQLLVERYWDSGPDEHADTMSVTTSITGALVGAALADGSLRDLEQPLGELLPDEAARMSPTVASITRRQLLTMTAGLPGDGSDLPAWTQGQDWVDDILTGSLAVRAPLPRGRGVGR